MTFLLVGLGGALGAISRFAVAAPLNAVFEHFFLGTFFVNFLGAFFFGFFWESAPNPRQFHFFATGFLGAFTTFSTFAGENVRLLETGKTLAAGGYFLTTILAGFFGFFVGKFLGKMIFGK